MKKKCLKSISATKEKKWSKGTTIAREQKCPATTREQIGTKGVHLSRSGKHTAIKIKN